MEFPLVSFIVPAYNVQDTIDRCLSSICSQTYPHLEIILLNDGSTDNTPALCDQWGAKDSRITVVHKANSGLSYTRNEGIKLARGKYIQFADTDDYLAPDFTAKMVAAAETHNAELVIAPYWMVFPEHYIDRPNPVEKLVNLVRPRNCSGTLTFNFLPAGVYKQKDYARRLMDYPSSFYFNVVWNKLYLRDVLLEHKLWFTKEVFAEDQLFNTLYLSFVQTAVSISTPGYYYIQNPKSLCHASVSLQASIFCRKRMQHYYKELYTKLGLYHALYFKIQMAAFGENEYTLPPLELPQDHFCKL